MTGCQLSVNLNAVAHLRNRRDVGWPNVAEYGRKILEAGAVGLTIHPRPDERHIRHSDVYELAELFKDSHFKDKEYNIEGYPDKRFMDLVIDVKPHQVTLVPDSPEQSTSDHGWDFKASSNLLISSIKAIKMAGMRSAVFIDPDEKSADGAKRVGADRVEIFTGIFGAETPDENSQNAKNIILANERARALGLGVNAGHDLTVDNMPILAGLGANIDEVSIGHGFWSDAWLDGMADTVSRFSAIAATLHPAGRQ